MAKHVQLHVRLGEPDWAKHTYARTEDDAGLTLLGSVQRGLQRGALAQKSDGTYIMLVGDFEMPLNQHQVRAALQSGRTAPPPRVTWSAPKPSTTVPVVVIKKRRVVSAST